MTDELASEGVERWGSFYSSPAGGGGGGGDGCAFIKIITTLKGESFPLSLSRSLCYSLYE